MTYSNLQVLKLGDSLCLTVVYALEFVMKVLFLELEDIVTGDRLTPSFGFSDGMVVQEFCWDEDVDQVLRDAVEAAVGCELVDESFEDVVDGAIVWWRSDDGDGDDLTDLLVDASSNLDNGGLIWVLTPKAGSAVHVPPAEIVEAAKTAGLGTTSAQKMGSEWSGIKLSARGR